MTHPASGRAAALVGRDDEVETLDHALRDARRSRGSTVFLAGEPGIGKTRLAVETAAMAQRAGLAVLRGRCSTTGPAFPFRPLTEALLALTRAGEAPPAAALGPYLPVLGRLVPEWSTGAECDQSPIILAEAVLRLASAHGQGRGCLLLIDDLHDADPETLAVIEYLAANLGGEPVALVATVRTAPSAARELADAVSQRREGRLLTLGRLGPAHLSAFAASCLQAPPEALPAGLSERLAEDSGGIPFVAEELIRGLLIAGRLTRGDDGWELAGTDRPGVPFTLVRAVEQRAARLGPDGVRLLSAAAVLGRSFPLSVVRRCAGLDDTALRRYLRAAVAESLLRPEDERGPDWYAFAHPLAEEALLSLLTPAERAELSLRAADAVDELYPGLPGAWCHLAARLRRQAGDRQAAAALYLTVARGALAGSGPGTAIAVLDEAQRMLGDAPDLPVRAGVHRDLLETQLLAFAQDGRFDQAAGVVERLRRADTGQPAEADPARGAELHVRLAWAAEVAGRWPEGMDHVAAARALLPGDAAERHTAGIDAVEAYLTVSGAEQGRIGRSEELARRAIEGAEQRGDQALACQAWYAVGFASRGRSLDESDRAFRRTLQIATGAGLTVWRNHGLIGLGNNAWLAEADPKPLAYAHQEALRTGCVSLAHNAGAVLALDAVLRSDAGRAAELLDGSLGQTRRLQLHSVTRYALMLRAVLAAHRARRADMRAALAEFRACGGEQSREAPLARGLAELFCALLEEDRPLAAEVAAELVVEAGPDEENFFHLSGTRGLVVLLAVLDGRGDRAGTERVAAGQAGRMRWNRQFLGMAEAVLLGREGCGEEAEKALRDALAAAEVFPVARHLGLRLVADAAAADGWGEPRVWFAEAEEFFHRTGVVAVAGACRARLRDLGVVVRQRRTGTDLIPDELRTLGVTSREYDVFRLLVHRLSNKALATRLHISTRTVEKHVASLLSKTGTPDRDRLCDFTADFMAAAGG